VTATVLRTCSVSTSSLSIANYDPSVRIAATDHTGSTELTVVCKRGATSAIRIDGGSDTPGVVTSRVTISENDMLRHEASKNAGQSQGWSDSASAVLNRRRTKGIVPQSISVYSRISHNQPVGGGSDVETVTYTINF
jgi:spore coat protein U-like protein